MHGKLDSPYLRFTLGPIGLALSLIILAVSASMNFRFGYSLGRSPLDSWIYGWASVGADGLKAIAPFFFFAAFGVRRWSMAVAAGIVWLICTGYGLTSAAGHAALNRLDTTGHRALVADGYKDLRADKARIEKELESWTAAVNKPSAAIKADIDGAKFGKMWTTTSGCTTEVVTKDRREFCQNIQRLEADLGTAQKREEYQAKLEDVMGKLAKATGAESAAALSEADPQASILSRLSKLDIPTTQLALAILIVLMLEAGGGLGPYASIWYMSGGPARVLDLTPETTAPASIEKPALPPPVAAAPIALVEASGGHAKPEPPPVTPAPAVAVTRPEAANDPAPAPSKGAPGNPFLRRPNPAAEAELRSIKWPLSGTPAGGQRPQDGVALSTEKFVKAVQAFGLAGKPIWLDKPHPVAESQLHFETLYAQLCQADHREMSSPKEVLERLKGQPKYVEYKRIRIVPEDRNSNKRYCFEIAPRSRWTKPVAAEVEEPAPTPPEVGTQERGPFSAASWGAANDTAPLPSQQRRPVTPTRSFQPDYERWEIAQSRALKAAERGMSRKQRGAGVHRMLRAA